MDTYFVFNLTDNWLILVIYANIKQEDLKYVQKNDEHKLFYPIIKSVTFWS